MVCLVTIDSGRQIVFPLCQRCCEEAFSLESWKKLFGVHPKTPGLGNDPKITNANFDGKFQYATVHMGAKDLPPVRGPILRLRVPVKGLMLSSEECGFCQMVVNLDTNDNLAKGRYKDAQVDMQIFYPVKYSGTWLPFVMQVTLTLESENRKKRREYKNSRLLAFLSQSEGANKGQEPSDEEAAMPDPVHDLLKEAKQWMEECENCHTDCALTHESLLPRRVLDLQALENVGKVKLVESTDLQHGRYVALSYVWGKNSFLRLQRENRETLMDAILLTDLPRTIRDAAQVTQALNVRYLWVDSLCILQDSDTDKTLEIPHMNAYYRQATAVISASGATDVHSGFLGFQSTEDDIYARANSRLVADDPEFGPMSCRFPAYYPFDDGESLEICHVDLDPPLYNYNTEPINRRGWTLQEASLARRLLIFPKAGGMVMRCLEGERFAGHLLGNPFHEEAGSLYPETANPVRNDDQEDDESLEDEDSEGSSREEGSKDDDEKDVEESSRQKLRRETESGSENQGDEYKGSDEGIDEGSCVGSAGSSDGFDVKSGDESGESQTHPVEDRRWVFWTRKREANQDFATDQGEAWVERADWEDGDTESSTEGHLSGYNIHDDEHDDEHEDSHDGERDVQIRNEQHDEQNETSEKWFGMVQDYSQRALSQPDDILIALGALAQEFHIQHENILGSYAAGLWTKTLKEGLLWHLSYPHHPDRESFIPPQKGATEYRAPSWSWASSEQPVTFRTQREANLLLDEYEPEEPTWHIEIMDCRITPRDVRNPFGALHTACLDVKGILAPIQRVPGSRWHKPDRCPVDDVALMGNDGDLDFNRTDVFAPDSIEALEKIDSSCYWLLVYDATRNRARGLIIRKVASGQYRRLGFAEFQTDASNVQGEKSLIRLI